MKKFVLFLVLILTHISALAQISTANKRDWIEELDSCQDDCRAKALDIIQLYKKYYPETVFRLSDTAKVTYLYFHSFTLNPSDNLIFIDALKKKKNVNIYAPLFSAHNSSSTPSDYRRLTYQDWWTDAELGLKLASKLGQKVVIEGFSIGGLFSLQLAKKFPELIDQIILVAPAIMITSGADDLACAGKSGFVKFLAKIGRGESSEYLDKYLNGSCAISKSIFQIRDEYKIADTSLYSGDINNRSAEQRQIRFEQIALLARDIKVKTMLIYSKKDNALDVDALDVLAKNLDNATVIVYQSNQNIDHLASILNYQGKDMNKPTYSMIMDALSNAAGEDLK